LLSSEESSLLKMCSIIIAVTNMFDLSFWDNF